MIICTVTDGQLFDQKTKGFVVLASEGDDLSKETKFLAKDQQALLAALIKERSFSGKKGSTLTFPFMQGKTLSYLLIIGLGSSKKTYALETVREVVARAVRMAESLKLDAVALELPEAKMFEFSYEQVVQEVVVAAHKAAYAFDEFITDKDARTFKVEKMMLCVDKKQVSSAKQAVATGTIIAQAINRARYWVDLPANMMTPHSFADHAKKVAKEHGLKITVFNEDQIEKMGMGGLKAVGMGSQHDSHLVIVEYKTKKKNAPTLAFVGKGITFDSGGLNIKPTGYMEDMKDDMSGAAAVVNAVAALAELGCEVNVVGLAPLAENMVSGNANHPGDILTFYNGKTAIVGNTDAEGRLVLADALAYADKHYKPTAMVDVATLTGACVHAVGPFYSGLMTQDEDLCKKIEVAAHTSGDHVWRLPLTDEYKVMVKGDHTDLCNDGKTKYKAGATNGACFLSNFVGSTPWAHLDIAPTAFNVPDKPYFRSGIATGAGTHLLIDLAMQWK